LNIAFNRRYLHHRCRRRCRRRHIYSKVNIELATSKTAKTVKKRDDMYIRLDDFAKFASFCRS